jgi:transcription antitermination protein NusB
MGLRRKAREIAVQSLYMYDVADTNMEELLTYKWVEKKYNSKVLIYSTKLIQGAINNIREIDSEIKKSLNNDLSYKRMGIIEKAILRVSSYELIFEDIPDSIILNEAIEISKRFGSEFTYKYVNGILDGIRKNRKSPL